jgi:hypothetical protein
VNITFQWEFIFVRHYVRMWFTSCYDCWFGDLEIYHITNFTRITRILLSIESILRLYHHIIILGGK